MDCSTGQRVTARRLLSTASRQTIRPSLLSSTTSAPPTAPLLSPLLPTSSLPSPTHPCLARLSDLCRCHACSSAVRPAMRRRSLWRVTRAAYQPTARAASTTSDREAGIRRSRSWSSTLKRAQPADEEGGQVVMARSRFTVYIRPSIGRCVDDGPHWARVSGGF